MNMCHRGAFLKDYLDNSALFQHAVPATTEAPKMTRNYACTSAYRSENKLRVLKSCGRKGHIRAYFVACNYGPIS
jgi:hypothetical protein